jgi:hypothetical protein
MHVISSALEKSLDLSLLQNIRTKILPARVQSINQFNLLDSRPFLQLRFSSDGVADISVMFVIDQLFALILGGEPDLRAFAVLTGPARESVGHTNVKN